MLKKLRVYIDIISLFVSLLLARLCKAIGRQSAIALSVSKNEKDILYAEHPEGIAIFGGRIHKVKKKVVRLPSFAADLLSKVLLKANRAGIPVYIKGYADRSWGLSLSSLPQLYRIETSIWGKSAQDKNANSFSYILDNNGIYFDGRLATDLERKLNTVQSGFWREDAALSQFIDSLQNSSFQKYPQFAGAVTFTPPQEAVLVAGQVSGDASTIETTAAAQTNFELAQIARRTFPERPIYFKAHPFEKNEEETRRIIEQLDMVLVDPSLSFTQLCSVFKTVMVNTSGGGLEAALLGCQVYTVGVSFYSHWGFTSDIAAPVSRRTNRLSPEDVYACFVQQYARYALRQGSGTAPQAIDFEGFLTKNPPTTAANPS
ncbi:capsular polysaccharide export protein, LipB/KpsS family [Flexibacterium corallicola]|uniref:capsular polysaccharide export protein, LipB/KpsS family n=1 Tax=Flexibacterium corallicola TaxID=3037259 RepID=UPI00286EDEA5|nr:hypothetical protein [Pseudovibrio sp. M1P-2-3]